MRVVSDGMVKYSNTWKTFQLHSGCECGGEMYVQLLTVDAGRRRRGVGPDNGTVARPQQSGGALGRTQPLPIIRTTEDIVQELH